MKNLNRRAVAAVYLQYVTRSYRDVADRDYISARILYQLDLDAQFLWAAHQAVEKYLKAILLYNGEVTVRLGHNLNEAVRRVKQLSDLPLNWEKRAEEFIAYLHEEGPNRYFDYPAVAPDGREMFFLDLTVWELRRFCVPLRGAFYPGDPVPGVLKIELARLQRQSHDRPRSGDFFHGYLESVLREGPDRLRAALTWQNFYFSRRPRKVVKRPKIKSWSANPTHYLHPELYLALKGRVQFPKGVVDYFKTKHGI